MDRRHHQRHQQLHPVGDARARAAVRYGARGGAAARLRRSRSDASTSTASTPRTSSTILASIAFGVPINFAAAYTEGIAGLAAEDIKYAEQLGYRIKLLGITRRTAQGVELRVHPTLVPMQRLIASVEGAMNAVLVKGDAVGVTLYYGTGAGAEPTASAVVADLVDVTRMHTADPENRVPHLAFQADALADLPWLPHRRHGDLVLLPYARRRPARRAG